VFKTRRLSQLITLHKSYFYYQTIEKSINNNLRVLSHLKKTNFNIKSKSNFKNAYFKHAWPA